MNYPGIDGFLGTRASIMLDVVFVAMFAVLPILAWSIYQVKFKRRYALHKRTQLWLGVVLLAAVAAFEIDMQLVSGWRERAAGASGGPVSPRVERALAVHLVFAISTAILWVFVITQAQRKIPRPPGPCPYSRQHMFWARLAAIDMFLTALTGWIFYVLAFALD